MLWIYQYVSLDDTCRPQSSLVYLLCIYESYISWSVEAKWKTRLCSR